jgi:amino acid transporter
MGAQQQERTTLRRSLSVWQAVGISVALMAPSMAANINPQGTAGQVGRATPLAFFLAAVAVLLIAYVFVRLCQYYRHAGSVYVFAGATLGARAGAVAGFGLMATYVFYALVTSSAAGIFGSALLDALGLWTNQPDGAGFLVGGIALVLALVLAIVPARRGGGVLLSVVPGWKVVFPSLALVMLLYTLYRNVFPYPDEGPPRWFPVVAFGWLLLVTIVVLVVPGLAHRMSAAFRHLDESA